MLAVALYRIPIHVRARHGRAFGRGRRSKLPNSCVPTNTGHIANVRPTDQGIRVCGQEMGHAAALGGDRSSISGVGAS